MEVADSTQIPCLPLYRHSQHGRSSINADHMASGPNLRQPVADIARSAAQIQQDLIRSKGTVVLNTKLAKTLHKRVVSPTEISVGIRLNLMEVIHQFRLRNALHHGQGDITCEIDAVMAKALGWKAMISLGEEPAG